MSGCESAKIIQINQDLTDKRSNIDSPCMDHSQSVFFSFLIICPIAVAYSIWQIIKPVCLSVYLCIRLCALSWSHFFIDFHQNWHTRKNPWK